MVSFFPFSVPFDSDSALPNGHLLSALIPSTNGPIFHSMEGLHPFFPRSGHKEGGNGV
jgi:hypothetical protein